MAVENPGRRLGLIGLCAVTLFGALFARLWILQVVQSDALDQVVNASTTRTIILPAARGNIYDVNGLPLVENVETTVVSIDRQAFDEMDDDEQTRALTDLVTAVNRFYPPAEALTVADVERRMTDARYSAFRPVPVLEGIDLALEIHLEENADRFPAVGVDRATVRRYPYGQLAAHVLGRVGAITPELLEAKADVADKPYDQNDEIGLAGVEQSYESYLRGTPGREVIEVDRRNRKVRELVDQRIDPVPGDDVYLSIDLRLQYIAEEALRAWIINSETDFPRGAAVIEDPRNGQILAMASYPTFDPSDLVGGISTPLWQELMVDQPKPGLNRAMSEGFPAASTYKLATAYAGLELGLTTPDRIYVDEGVYKLCDLPYDWCEKQNSGRTRYGPIDLTDSLRVSSDTYYYRIGVESWEGRGGWGEGALQEKMGELGYGERTGIELPGEFGGVVPTPESNAELQDALWERGAFGDDEQRWQQERLWQSGDSANISTGQGDVLATPLQTANAYASLANPDGILYEPSVVSRVTESASLVAEGEVPEVRYAFQKEEREKRRIDYGSNRQSLLDGFAGAVREAGGTARAVFEGFPLDTFPLYGKTGTAEVGFGDGHRDDNSMFVAFGPDPDPRYVVSVLIEGGGFGSHAAAPAARMMLEPIATGELETFVVPRSGAIDAEGAAARTDHYQAVGTD